MQDAVPTDGSATSKPHQHQPGTRGGDGVTADLDSAAGGGMVTTKVRAVLYLRVSSTQQARRDGQEEGYSIPAQREACLHFLEQKGWEFAGEFVDAGESARSADRPALQQMLLAIKDDPTITACVCHKVDRIARNLEDHAGIRAALKKAGARLVSATEGIEDTPSGKLVEGILASISEYYSANLANEIRKGQHQKAKMGGWPRRAPIGYLNRRETINGHSVATVIKDPDRAPLVLEGFELYATGDISSLQLAETIYERGLRSSLGRPVSAARWVEIMRNPFYLGRVVWGDEEYQGAHQPLVTPDLFNRVETVLQVRDTAGVRDHHHTHHLKGTLRCGACGSLLSFTRSKGRSARYDYYFCLGKKKCSQPFTPVPQIEQAVEELFDTIVLPDNEAERLRTELEAVIPMLRDRQHEQRRRLERRRSKLTRERTKLLHAHYDDALPLDLLKTEQRRISHELLEIDYQLSTLSTALDVAHQQIDQALKLATVAPRRYRTYTPETRRRFNRAIFKAIYVTDRQISSYEHTELVEPVVRTAGTLLASGSNERAMVELSGFEPLCCCIASHGR